MTFPMGTRCGECGADIHHHAPDCPNRLDVAALEQATRQARREVPIALIDDTNWRTLQQIGRCVYDTDSPTGHQLDELVNAALDGWFHYQRTLAQSRPKEPAA